MKEYTACFFGEASENCKTFHLSSSLGLDLCIFMKLFESCLLTQSLECRCGVSVNNNYEMMTKTVPNKIYKHEVEWGEGEEAIIIFTVPSFKLESDIRVYNLQNLASLAYWKPVTVLWDTRSPVWIQLNSVGFRYFILYYAWSVHTSLYMQFYITKFSYISTEAVFNNLKNTGIN